MRYEEILALLSWRDVIDILAVAIVVYNLLLLIRGTRAVQILLGTLVVVFVAYLAQAFELRSLKALLDTFIQILPVAILILFQSQIRQALASFGKNPLFGFSVQEQVESGFQEIVLAATTLANRSIGALIVIERLEGLREYIENGIALDAEVSFDLLLTIFQPETPLHDGAVIVQKDRLAAAACFLPLTSNPELSTQSGTRHRAALGISEETDAVAIVVSEETGRISVAIGGELIENLDARRLRNTLYRSLVAEAETPQVGG